MGNQIKINLCNNEVVVPQSSTSIIQVAAVGPQGPVGPAQPFTEVSASTYATDNNIQITGSLNVTGPISASSFIGSISASNVVGLNLALISTGSITASVNVGDDTFRITSGLSTFLYVSSSGNIGIGTTTPNARLNIAGTLTQGDQTIASGIYSHAEGYGTTASGSYSHAEGTFTTAFGDYSHAEGDQTIALGNYSHAEGYRTIASGIYSHAEGGDTTALGLYSHAEGANTTASGQYSHAEGYGTVALGNFQHTTGQFNISSSAQSAFIIGNGVDTNNRSNLLFASGSQVQITGSLNVSGSITSTNTFVQGGNSFGTTAILGTNDNQNLQFETSGSVRVHIGNTGNVGIGTTSPISTLSVAFGNINIGTGYGIGGNYLGVYDPFIRYNHTGISGTQSSSFGHTTAYMLSDSGGPNDISFYAGAVTQPEIMRIVGSNGFVGIGESSPSAKLEIRGSGATSATTALRVENSASTARFTILDDGTSAFNTSHLYVSSSGRVGIGTSTPTNTLQVNGGITATSFTGSFSGSVRAPGASGDLLMNFGNVLGSANGVGVVSLANAITVTDIVSIPGTDAGGLRLIVGPGDGNPKHYAIIPETYTSKGEAALGNKSFSTTQRQAGGKQIQDFILTTGITGGDPKTGTTASVMSLTEDQNVGIGTTTPTAKLQVVGSVLISGSSTLTNIGPAIFSGSITQQPNFTASLGYLLANSALINGDVTVTGTASINTLKINEIIVSTGSNQFGDAANDTQTLYGSVIIPTGSLTVTGSTNITGSLNVTSGITGSLFGTSSNAINAQTASFLPVATYQITSSWAQSASNAINAQTASFITPTGTNAFVQGGNSFGATALLGTNDTQDLQLETSGSVRMTISSGGRVGIGTTTPIAQLHVTNSMLVNGTSDYFGGIDTTVPIQMFAGVANNGIGFRTDNFYLYPYGSSTRVFWGWNGNAAWNLRNNNTSSFQIYNNSPTDAVMLTVSSSGNVGIGTTTPSSRLEITHNSSGVAKFEKTSGAVGTILEIRGNTDDKLLSFWRAGVERAYIDIVSGNLTIGANNKDINLITGTGNVSIGTTSPTSRLQVKGSGATSATTALRVENNNATSLLTILNDGTSAFNTNHLYVSSSGNVGIGTGTPGVALDVVGQIRASSTMFNSTTQTNTIQLNTGTNLRFLSASVETARYDNNGWGFFNNAPAAKVHISGANADSLFMVSSPSAPSALFVSGSGNIGIGTTSPTERLHISQSSGIFQRVDINNANANGVNATTRYYTNTGIAPDFFGATSFRLQGGTTDAFKQFQVYIADLTSPRFIINGSGNVGINTTSPNARLHISGANSDVLLIASSSTASSALFVSGSGNVGIGTTTPSTTLQVAGTSSLQNIVFDTNSTYDIGTISTRVRNIWSNGSIVGVGGTFNNLVTYFTASIGGGASGFTPSANLHVSGASNSNLLRVSSPTQTNILFVSGSGNVGIGTTTPTTTLNVNGTTLLQGGQTTVRGSGATSATTAFRVENSNASASLTILDDGTSAFNTNYLYVSSSGLVGIGTNLPTAELHVSGANADTLLRVGSPSAPSALFVSGSGNVGIGTATPASRLQVSLPSNTSNQSIFRSDAGDNLLAINTFLTTNRMQLLLGDYNGTATPNLAAISDSNTGIQWAGSDIIRFVNGGSENVTINASGNVGIGTATPSSRLHARGTGATSATTALRVENSNATASLTILNDGTSAFNTNHLYVSSSGNVGIGTTSPSSKLHISGADAIMTLSPIDPLPTTNIPSASFATSGSGANLKPYFWNGSTWTALF